MSDVFQRLLQEGLDQGIVPNRTQEARDWFRQRALRENISPRRVVSTIDQERFTNIPRLGRMYIFRYLPKYRAQLPIYDRFPLIILFRRVGNGFLGLNVHYLPLSWRARFFDTLYKVTSDKNYDEETIFKVTWTILKALFAFNRNYLRCVRRYRFDHMLSKLMLIEAQEWDIALFLPVAEWNTPLTVFNNPVLNTRQSKPQKIRKAKIKKK